MCPNPFAHRYIDFMDSVAATAAVAPAVSVGNRKSGETEFAAWVKHQFDDAPGRQDHAAVLNDAITSIVKWRRRYHGAQVGIL